VIYLSQLILNPASHMAQSELNKPYEMHRTLMRGFDGKREDANVLYRLDIHQYSDVMALLVQSTVEPNWETLTQVGQGQYLLSPPVWKGIELDFPNGRILQFRLTANPTKRLSNGRGNKPGPRRALYSEVDQCDWLHKKAKQHGFHMLHLQISHAQKQTDKKRNLTLLTVQFNGRLQITNTALFNQALRQGIGPAKAFGCGLLSLAPG
jgi:CRISPR system Cascade subunit CasE